MSIYDEIGRTIVDMRGQKGLTQKQLARECRISVSYLRRIEYGDANPTIRELCRIAEALNIELQNPFDIPASVETVS